VNISDCVYIRCHNNVTMKHLLSCCRHRIVMNGAWVSCIKNTECWTGISHLLRFLIYAISSQLRDYLLSSNIETFLSGCKLRGFWFHLLFSWPSANIGCDPFSNNILAVNDHVHQDCREYALRTYNVDHSSPENYLALSPLFVDIDLLVPLDAEFYALSPRTFS